MTTPAEVAQSPQPDALVTLFDVDVSFLSPGLVYYFTPGTLGGTNITWRGNVYSPYPVEVSGFEIIGQGTQPSPKITLSNVTSLFALLTASYQDLVGAKVTRWQTFARFLDGESEADPDSFLRHDIYRVERKTKQNKTTIEFELSSVMDHDGVQLPKRQCFRDGCVWLYRRWNGSAFDYTGVQCPYAGTNYFKADGTPTTAASEDICGKRLSDCQLRFGATSPLPTSAFPGIGQLRG